MIKRAAAIAILAFLALLAYSWKLVPTSIPQVSPMNRSSGMVSQGTIPHQLDYEVGAGSGVDIDQQGNIYFLHRAGYGFSNTQLIEKDVVYVFSAHEHTLISSWGANTFKSPHGITIDGQGHIWITDVMQNKVYRFDKQGNMIRVYGNEYPFYLEACLQIRTRLKRLPCFHNPSTFARPTDVEVYSDGSFVVSDGYRNSRIVKFAADGELIWEVNGIGDGDGEFFLPHGLTKGASGKLYVADRRNARVQVFDKNGSWLETWEHPDLGRPYALDIGSDGYLYIVDAGDSHDVPHGKNRSQLIKLTLTGDIVDRYSAFGQAAGEMDLPHDIAVADSGRIFVAEINNQRIQFFGQRALNAILEE